MKYAISYEHLYEDLVNNDRTKKAFNKVRDEANSRRVELEDEEFSHLFDLTKDDCDITWILNCMNEECNFVQALISFIQASR